MRIAFPSLGLLLVALSGATALADVNLVTIPRREETQLTIYNSEDVTMVRETRLLTLKKGINLIQFSWANTLIDPTSIDFRILDQAGKVDLVDTTFPAGRSDALQWNIRSGMDGKAAVEIRYFTSGITWTADYVGIANRDEAKIGLTGYVRVFNNSGEDYENAQVRLVVGTINLVEKIADLAIRDSIQKKRGKGGKYGDYDLEARRAARDELEAYYKKSEAKEGGSGSQEAPEDAKQVVKEGLSEYFLFTIEGREEIKNREPKRLVAMKAAEVPLECLYKLTDRDGGAGFTKFYRFKNVKLLDAGGKEKKLSAMENLGVSPLPNGMVRLFFEYPNQDLAYVGGTEVKYVPIGDRVEVNVGPDPDITIVRRLKDQAVSNVIARQYKRRQDDEWMWYYDLLDYDTTFSYEEEIVSGKAVPVKVELERRFAADVVLWGNGDKPADWAADKPGAFVDLHSVESRIEKVDQNHVKYFLDMQPGRKWKVAYAVTYKTRREGPELNTDKRREPR
jgi:hypothetical protein